jgi:hypothetical protein
MNCDQALELMLDADLAAMSATLETPLGEHLQACAWCRRAATQLVDDTRSLAAAMAMPTVDRHSRWTRRAYESAPLAVAAGILVMLTVQVWQQSTVVNQPNVLPTVIVNAPLPPPIAPASVTPPVRAVKPVVESAPVVSLRAFPAARPITTVAMTIPASAATPARLMASNAVSVTPPVGTRAVVMQTGDPKLVVVWLYDPEESR